MSNQALVKQPNQAVQPAGKNSLAALDFANATVVPVVFVVNKDGNKAIPPHGGCNKAIPQLGGGNMPMPQQSTTSQPSMTINVQINYNNITNNYKSETPNQGHQGHSRDGLNQGLQPTAPTSRTPENRLTGAESAPSVPSTSYPTHKTDPKSQNGSRENSSTSRPATTQTRPTQDIHRLESTPIPTTRPATSQVPSRHQQQATQKPFPTNVPATHVQEQNRREKPQTNGNKHNWFSKLLLPHSDHENGSQPNSNFPNSATRSNASGSRGGRTDSSRAGSAAGRLQKQHISPALYHQNQASHHQILAPHHQTQAPPHQKLSGPPHGEPQSRRLDGAVRAPQGQLAVNQGAGATPEVAKDLKAEDIERHLKHLDTLFGQEKTRSGCASLILIGKASATIRKLDLGDEKPYHIDMMLDLQATDKRRDCMKRPEISRVFREFKKPTKEDGTGPWESFFGQSRANVFKNAVPKGTRKFHEMQHLQVYLMDRECALEFEFRRLADPRSDEATKKASEKLAVDLLWSLTNEGRMPWSEDRCKRMYCIRQGKDATIPDSSITVVKKLFRTVHDKQGIVKRRPIEGNGWEYLLENRDGEPLGWEPYPR